MQGFTPKPVNQAGLREAGKGIANGGARQRRRGKMHIGAYRVAGSLMRG